MPILISKSLDDEALKSLADDAYADTISASESSPNSPRHEECFAGLYVCCAEMSRRGIRRANNGKER